MRSEELYLMCVCHKIGVKGLGPHKHNDWLSFELCVGKHPVIIDPGTYCYTGNIKMRRMFRSTAYHNTVAVDGEEQIPIHNSMFALINPFGDIGVLDWQSEKTFDLLTAEHTGYQRLTSPVVHRRSFYLDKKKNRISIEDSFHGKGIHEVQFYFHLDTDITCELANRKAIFSKRGHALLAMETSYADVELMIHNGWVSRAYNRKEAAQILSWKATVDVAASQSVQHIFVLHEYPHSNLETNNCI